MLDDLDTGCWMLDTGCSLDAGYSILDAGCSLDAGYSILDAGYWMLDTRYPIIERR